MVWWSVRAERQQGCLTCLRTRHTSLLSAADWLVCVCTSISARLHAFSLPRSSISPSQPPYPHSPSLPPSLPRLPPLHAYEVASLSQRDVQTSDFIFLIRKDVRRYKRMKDLLEADEELRDARDPKVKKLTET
jgi:hypothetical protein